jgi:hypothetical protein
MDTINEANDHSVHADHPIIDEELRERFEGEAISACTE